MVVNIKLDVTKPDGTPYAGGIVNVGIDELLDRKLGNEPYGCLFCWISKMQQVNILHKVK